MFLQFFGSYFLYIKVRLIETFMIYEQDLGEHY